MYEGRDIALTCDACYQKDSYHPNDLIAEIRKSVIVVALLVFFITGGAIAFLFFGFYTDHLLSESSAAFLSDSFVFVVLPFVLFGLIIGMEKRKVYLFNVYRIKR